MDKPPITRRKARIFERFNFAKGMVVAPQAGLIVKVLERVGLA